MSELLKLDLCGTLMALKRGDFSALELAQSYLKSIENNKDLNIYITVTEEIALAQAKASDQRRASGQEGPLDGIPLAVKDAFCTKGVLTTSASAILSRFIPPYESTVTQRLWDSGGVLLGKVNLDEFCMGSTTGNSYFGPTYNPWNASCTTGGSSGGSAAAVASGTALAAIGSDTGGSVRQPASFCGVVGVKPTYGRCSRFGITAFASSLDQAGTLTRSVRDGAYLLSIISGHDPKDSTSSFEEVPDFSKCCGNSIKGLRVGIPKEWYEFKGDPIILEQWERGKKFLEDAGCSIQFVSLPNTTKALACYYIIACAEAASNLSRYDGIKYGLRMEGNDLEDMYEKTRGCGFGQEVKRRVLIGTYVLSQGYYDCYYGKAQKVRQRMVEDFHRAFQEVDVLLAPTTPTPAFPFDQAPEDPVTMYLNDVLTVPVNIGGVCGLSVPCGLSEQGMPLGLQIIAPPFQEDRLFKVASVLETCCEFPNLPFFK